MPVLLTEKKSYFTKLNFKLYTLSLLLRLHTILSFLRNWNKKRLFILENKVLLKASFIDLRLIDNDFFI